MYCFIVDSASNPPVQKMAVMRVAICHPTVITEEEEEAGGSGFVYWLLQLLQAGMVSKIPLELK